MDREALDKYVADLLDVAAFDDYCVNGLQVEGCSEVRKVATGVSVSQRLFSEAISLDVDTIVVHHGLFWKNSPHPLALTGHLRERVKLLVENDINLFGYHLPLDAHSTMGNNALIAQALELEIREFVPIKITGNPIAAVGDLKIPMPFVQFKQIIDQRMNSEGLGLQLTEKEVRRVFILAGSGGSYFQDAADAGADLILTGELHEDVVRSAEELGINLYAAGHYNSEKWGIRALGEHLREKFSIEVEFIDIPNPV